MTLAVIIGFSVASCGEYWEDGIVWNDTDPVYWGAWFTVTVGEDEDLPVGEGVFYNKAFITELVFGSYNGGNTLYDLSHDLSYIDNEAGYASLFRSLNEVIDWVGGKSYFAADDINEFRAAVRRASEVTGFAEKNDDTTWTIYLVGEKGKNPELEVELKSKISISESILLDAVIKFNSKPASGIQVSSFTLSIVNGDNELTYEGITYTLNEIIDIGAITWYEVDDGDNIYDGTNGLAEYVVNQAVNFASNGGFTSNKYAARFSLTITRDGFEFDPNLTTKAFDEALYDADLVVSGLNKVLTFTVIFEVAP